MSPGTRAAVSAEPEPVAARLHGVPRVERTERAACAHAFPCEVMPCC